MNKKLLINDCHECPHRKPMVGTPTIGLLSGSGNGSLPECKLSYGGILEVQVIDGIPSEVEGIPEWCPLEEY